jgi:UDP-galactopyranose mutase
MAFFAKGKGVHLGKEAESIDREKKVILFQDGSETTYDTLIPSLPLDELLERIKPLPDAINDFKNSLRYVSVININLGVKRERISDFHWIYYTEPAYPFYRVGFPSNLSPHMAPKGTSSVSVEISHLPSHPPSVDQVREETLSSLIACGVLREDDEILTEHILMIKHAYVIYDLFRYQQLSSIIQFLRSQQIYPIGRYGLWEYVQGRDIAQELS